MPGFSWKYHPHRCQYLHQHHLLHSFYPHTAWFSTLPLYNYPNTWSLAFTLRVQLAMGYLVPENFVKGKEDLVHHTKAHLFNRLNLLSFKVFFFMVVFWLRVTFWSGSAGWNMVLWEALRTPKETVEIDTWLKRTSIFDQYWFSSCCGILPGVFFSCACGNLNTTRSPVDLVNFTVCLHC